MVSVAVATADAKLEEQIRAREPQIRDVLIALLERQTLESLGQPGARDSIKRAMTDTITALAAGGGKIQVYLPQFVIQ
jgi:flagellar basal body-associated protein FliL